MPQCDGQVEARAFLTDVSRGQIQGDMRRRDVVAAVAECGPDTVAAFPHGCVGQAHGVRVIFAGLDAGDVDLNLNDAGVNALNGGAEGVVEHERQCSRS
jgi:hypothetical protein